MVHKEFQEGLARSFLGSDAHGTATVAVTGSQRKLAPSALPGAPQGATVVGSQLLSDDFVIPGRIENLRLDSLPL
jgi:hypothetical protein